MTLLEFGCQNAQDDVTGILCRIYEKSTKLWTWKKSTECLLVFFIHSPPPIVEYHYKY